METLEEQESRLSHNKQSMDYYWKTPTYRNKKMQSMREYMMNRRIKEGCWGSLQSIFKIIGGI